MRTAIHFTAIMSAAIGLTTFAAPLSAQPVPDYGFEWTTVGDPGNPPTRSEEVPLDPGRQVGAVGYEYRIMTSKVSTADYLEFVEAYAPFWQDSADVFDLTGLWITSSPNPDGSHGFEMRPGSANYAARITWEQSARYCNWLHNGKISEAWAFETGAYDASTFVHDDSGWQHQTSHLPGARFWIPNIDEWVKAAHYDPDRYGSGMGGYWTYPDSSDQPLIEGLPEDGGETIGDMTWNLGFNTLGEWDLDRYPHVQSPWGLRDISGTAYEYTETIRFLNTPVVFQGGSLAGDASWFAFDRIDFESSGVLWGSTLGSLRIAGLVPAASTWPLAFGVFGLATRRSRRSCLSW